MKRTALLLFFTCVLGAARVGAQPVRQRILSSLSVERTAEGHHVRVHFESPVRYLRHSPRDHAREVRVQLQHLALAPTRRAPADLRESLQSPPGSSLPLQEVVYDGNASGGPVLEVRFTRAVDFELRQGDDLRSILIVVSPRRRSLLEVPPMPRPPDFDVPPIRIEYRFAVELETVSGEESPSAPPHDPLFDRYRLYRVPVQVGEQLFERYRLGFLPSKKAAQQAVLQLSSVYPQASVVPTSRAERAASAQRAVSAAALRNTARVATPAIPEHSGLPRTSEREPAVLLARGRAAMTSGDLDLAIRLFTAILAGPDAAESGEAQEAQELLAVVRERRGQLAHAKAEYEVYLARYPEGEGALRVRQRLDSLLSRSAPDREKLRPARSMEEAWDLTSFGSVYSSYYRSDLQQQVTDELVSSSVAFTDLSFSSRLRKGDFDLRARGAGSYRYDIPLDSAIDEFRISSLFAEARDRGRGLEGAIGRQSANSGGVLGRFDGLRLGVSVLDGWKLGSVAGFPVELSSVPGLDTDRVFTGVSLDSPRFGESVDTQIWAIGQQAEGTLDRAAIGGELRYIAPSGLLAGFLDYDVHFGQLNTALLIGNWSYSPDTSFNLTLDHRTTPVLRAQNALIGQTADSIHELSNAFSSDEIAELAEDRTARSSLGMLGVNRHLSESVQLSADATVTHLTGTGSSGGVLATEGTGPEYAFSLQLLANGVFVERDLASARLRVFAGEFANSYSLHFGTLLPLSEGLRVHPLLLVQYEDRRVGSDAISVEPTFRIDWSFWKLDLDCELTLEWTDRSGDFDAGSEYGYRAQVGLGYDFE